MTTIILRNKFNGLGFKDDEQSWLDSVPRYSHFFWRRCWRMGD
ncbi:hypothetical protein THOE12_20449 [Vibrio rotiferianus]|nr:hypothetical protein THOE12_20449 [Vibrio rotiferianus]